MRAVDFVGCVLGYSLATTMLWAHQEPQGGSSRAPRAAPVRVAAPAISVRPAPSTSASHRAF